MSKELKQLPTSIYQKSFMLEWMKDPNDSAYNISATYKIIGNCLLLKHPAL